MPTEIRSRWLMLALVTLLSVSCKQKSKEEADPAVAPSASAAPAETAPPTPPPPETIAPPTQPPPAVVAAAPKAESLKTCCAALHKEEGTATPSQKSLYQTTAASCDAISKLVTVGTTKKSAALATLRAGLKGAKLPAGCE